MRGGIERGITTEGVLPGKLRVPRRAAALRRMLVSADKTTTDPMAVVDWINMFALAVNEENAAGGRVVTAPTNGACGIVPAVPYCIQSVPYGKMRSRPYRLETVAAQCHHSPVLVSAGRASLCPDGEREMRQSGD
jgi:L-serine deaminase